MFLLCFSVMSHSSLQSVLHKWLPEVQSTSPDVPIILVGTQSDLRHNLGRVLDLKRKGQNPVDSKYARKVAEQNHMEYIECSALTQHNLKEVFDLAILNALSRKKRQQVPEKQRAPTTFKESFRKLVTMTRKLI